MGIKAMLDSVDELPEAVKSYYKQDGDRFVLDIEEIDNHPSVRGVITANKTNKETRDRLRAEVEALKARTSFLPEDFDADAFENLRAAAEGKGTKTTDEQLAEIRAKAADAAAKKFQPEIETREQRIAKMDAALKRMVIDDGLMRAMDEARIAPEHRDMLLPGLKARAKIEIQEDGDAYKAAVDTDLGPVSLAQYVKEWAGSDSGKIYVAKSTGADPKGGRGGTGGSKTMKTDEFNALSAHERNSFMKAGGSLVD